MARGHGRLTAIAVAKKRDRGLYADGSGLYLQVAGSGARSWIYRFMLDGRPRWMGLGSANDIALAEARIRAAECRKTRADGKDPIEARKDKLRVARLDAARGLTFEECAKAFIEAKKVGWRNSKHAAQWSSTLETYAYPIFGSLPVQTVDTAMVMKVLEPIWTTKTETASRVRSRIENVLDWARTREYRQGENPARWRGHIENLLPARSSVRKVKHHAALPYDQMKSFTKALKNEDGVAALALEFLILTACRTNEAIGATWEEVDLKKALWVIPPERMKGNREHRVPLSERALQILKKLAPPGVNHPQGYVFRGGKEGKPLSNMALLALIKRMKRDGLTAHGFRSTFRDWAAEKTDFPSELAEMALAHVISNKVEAAYRRGDLFEKWRQLMKEWAKHCWAADSRPN
jgi:integrase